MTSSLRLPWHHVYSKISGSWPLPHTHLAWNPSIVCWSGLRPSLCPSPPTACVQGKWQTSWSAKIQIYKGPWFICLIPEHNWQYCTSTRMRTIRKRSLLIDCLSGRSFIRNQKREWLFPVLSKLAPRTVSGLLSAVTNLVFRVQLLGALFHVLRRRRNRAKSSWKIDVAWPFKGLFSQCHSLTFSFVILRYKHEWAETLYAACQAAPWIGFHVGYETLLLSIQGRW